MGIKAVLVLLLLVPIMSYGIEIAELQQVLSNANSPFHYPLNIKILPSTKSEADVMICCHGMGSNRDIVECVKSVPAVQDHLIGFNFPDANMSFNVNPEKTTFGTIQEILPVIYLIKQCVMNGGAKKVSLYGFSAGGGAIINVLGVLHQNRFADQLNNLGIYASERQEMISALQKGIIILDVPLKSIEEVIAFSGYDKFAATLQKRYSENDLTPIKSIKHLQGLSLDIIVYFNNPDEALSNRDDQLFINTLKKYNGGSTVGVIGHDQGHNSFHNGLWKAYKLRLGN